MLRAPTVVVGARVEQLVIVLAKQERNRCDLA